MRVKVQLVYPNRNNSTVGIEVKGGLKGPRLLDAVDAAVGVKFENDKGWTRWNLIEVEGR